MLSSRLIDGAGMVKLILSSSGCWNVEIAMSCQDAQCQDAQSNEVVCCLMAKAIVDKCSHLELYSIANEKPIEFIIQSFNDVVALLLQVIQNGLNFSSLLWQCQTNDRGINKHLCSI